MNQATRSTYLYNPVLHIWKEMLRFRIKYDTYVCALIQDQNSENTCYYQWQILFLSSGQTYHFSQNYLPLYYLYTFPTWSFKKPWKVWTVPNTNVLVEDCFADGLHGSNCSSKYGNVKVTQSLCLVPAFADHLHKDEYKGHFSGKLPYLCVWSYSQQQEVLGLCTYTLTSVFIDSSDVLSYQLCMTGRPTSYYQQC